MSGGIFVLNFYSPVFIDQLKRGRKTATVRLGDKSKKFGRITEDDEALDEDELVDHVPAGGKGLIPVPGRDRDHDRGLAQLERAGAVTGGDREDIAEEIGHQVHTDVGHVSKRYQPARQRGMPQNTD